MQTKGTESRSVFAWGWVSGRGKTKDCKGPRGNLSSDGYIHQLVSMVLWKDIYIYMPELKKSLSLCQYTAKSADFDLVGLGWGQQSAFLTSSPVMLMLFPYYVLSGTALSMHFVIYIYHPSTQQIHMAGTILVSVDTTFPPLNKVLLDVRVKILEYIGNH